MLLQLYHLLKTNKKLRKGILTKILTKKLDLTMMITK